MAQQMNIDEDQVNTANVWILRFVGTLEGTNLFKGCKRAKTNKELRRRNNGWLKVRQNSRKRDTHSMLACKLAATGFNGVELRELNLSLNEVAETPLDSFALPSGILELFGLHGFYGRSYVAGVVSARFTRDSE